jgi:hypothetical protein
LPDASLLEQLGSLRRARHNEDTHCWDEPEPQTFKVRGPTYLQDRVKIPAPADSTLMQLIAVELLRASQPIEHAAARPCSPAQHEGADNFVLAVNLQVPGSPSVSLVLYWAVQTRAPPDAALMARLQAFANELTDEARNAVFKLIPSVQEGNWMVRRAVGQTPVIVGRALHTSYHNSPGRYLEVDVDIGSSSVAAGVIRIVRGASRSLVVDLAFVLEGQAEADLPERPLATARLMCVDLDLAVDAHADQPRTSRARSPTPPEAAEGANAADAPDQRAPGGEPAAPGDGAAPADTSG